jgi:hypothetical protein
MSPVITDLNEAACGGGRYALARSNSFPFQLSGSSMGRIVIEESFLQQSGFAQVEQLLSAQGVRLLSPKEHNRPV